MDPSAATVRQTTACGRSAPRRLATATALLLVLASATPASGRRPSRCVSPRGSLAYSCLGAERARPLLLQDLREGRNVRDVATLADRLRMLIHDPELRLSMAQAACDMARGRFDVRKRVAALEDIYDEVAASFDAQR